MKILLNHGVTWVDPEDEASWCSSERREFSDWVTLKRT